MPQSTIENSQDIAVLKNEIVNMKLELSAANKKLDDLLVLKYKGMGVFWVVSILGAGILTVTEILTRWFHPY